MLRNPECPYILEIPLMIYERLAMDASHNSVDLQPFQAKERQKQSDDAYAFLLHLTPHLPASYNPSLCPTTSSKALFSVSMRDLEPPPKTRLPFDQRFFPLPSPLRSAVPPLEKYNHCPVGEFRSSSMPHTLDLESQGAVHEMVAFESEADRRSNRIRGIAVLALVMLTIYAVYHCCWADVIESLLDVRELPY
ncbi:hypothetical protein DL93DRAFT_244144 [Clavulina sp. PMI_390]|nr:hypothetical protein DL93DRAFT_244144 [Clavulina sp. PMI_390]